MYIVPEGGHWDDGTKGPPGSNGDWAAPNPGIHQRQHRQSRVHDGWFRRPRDRACNVAACETVVSILRCPSAALPDHVYGPSYENWIVQKRVPMSYAVNASGTSVQLYTDGDLLSSGYTPLSGVAGVNGANPANGAFQFEETINGAAVGNRIHIPEITDGLSNTIFIGEEYYQLLPMYTVAQLDLQGVARRKAVWQFGSDSLDCYYGMNEAFGSTGVPMNLRPSGREMA